MKPLIHLKDESLCQKWCVEDCHTARGEVKRLYDPMEVPSIAGECPLDCLLCLYAERHKRNDANWLPKPTDKQCHHWLSK